MMMMSPSLVQQNRKKIILPCPDLPENVGTATIKEKGHLRSFQGKLTNAQL